MQLLPALVYKSNYLSGQPPFLLFQPPKNVSSLFFKKINIFTPASDLEYKLRIADGCRLLMLTTNSLCKTKNNIYRNIQISIILLNKECSKQ